jgi:prephenate dehydrogenase
LNPAQGQVPVPAANPLNPQRIAVVGLGLLGASLAEAARRAWPAARISGVSSPETLDKAGRAGLIHDAFMYTEVDAALEDADFLFLCTPIDHIKGILEGWAKSPPTTRFGCIVSDVGSTKAGICALGRLAFRPDHPTGAVFIGSHPMAGSEKTGLEARDPLLFQNASWVLCPEADAPGPAVERLQAFVEALGARASRMAPELHDKVAAHVSHLPQLLSTALASFVGGRRAVLDNCLQMAGGGFRDMTRLAASSFAVWEPILRTNQAEVLEVLAGYRDHLAQLEKSLWNSRGSEFFKDGNRLRGRLSTSKKGFSTPLTEILVDLEDRPGALARALIPLAERGLNVQDLEILKVREGEAGVLMMAFRRVEEAQAALALLASAGFNGRMR